MWGVDDRILAYRYQDNLYLFRDPGTWIYVFPHLGNVFEEADPAETDTARAG